LLSKSRMLILRIPFLDWILYGFDASLEPADRRRWWIFFPVVDARDRMDRIRFRDVEIERGIEIGEGSRRITREYKRKKRQYEEKNIKC